MLFEQVEAARKYLSQYCENEYKIGLVLGTGLGALAEVIDVQSSVPYSQIPNFPVSTVESHAGELIFGLLDGVPVIAMSGRFHYYEGYSAKELSFPIRVLKALGVEKLILSNASGIWTVCSHKQINIDSLAQWARCVPEWGNFSYKPVIVSTKSNFYHLKNYSLLDTRRRIEQFFADNKI